MIAVVRWALAWPTPDAMFHSLADEVLLYPLAIRSAVPGAYPGDSWLDVAQQVFAPLYSALTGHLIATFDSPVRAAWCMSIFTGALFLSGGWVLLRRLGQGATAGLVLVAATAIPLLASASPGPGDALPRDILHALLPWFLVGLWSDRARRPTVVAGLGLGLGLATNVHPLMGVHIAMLLGLLLLCEPMPMSQGLRRAAALTAGFVLGAAPFVVRYLAYPRAGGPDPEVMELRVPGMLAAPLAESFEAWAPVLVIAVVAIVCWRAGTARRRLVAVLLTATLVGVLGERIGVLVPGLSQFQFGRLVRVAWFVALIALAGAVARAVQTRSIRTVLGTAFVVAFTLSSSLWSPPLHRGSRSLLGRTPPPVAPAPSRPRAGELTARSADDRREYLDLCRWCRERLPPDARVIVPPEDYSHFRLYARRSIMVSRKDGAFAATFLGTRGAEWLHEYRLVVGLYAAGDAIGFVQFAGEEGATHLLAESGDPRLPFPVVHESGPFVLYRIP